jgi:serine-type D-Ala-D-Ala endopeptidase (penicillin-binding protein 7)
MIRSSLGVLLSLALSVAILPNAAVAKSATEKTTNKTSKKPVAKKATVKRVAKNSSKKSRKLIAKSRTGKSKSASYAQRTQKSGYQRVSYSARSFVPAPATAGDIAGLHLTQDPLDLSSNAALVMDQNTAEILFEKNAQVALPIASITKLMTSLVVLEANQNMDEILQVTEEDIDTLKHTHSRLAIGSQLSRANMLHIALMSSENRAASALGRHYPGGLQAFVAAMNAKARALGMHSTRYVDSTGLSSGNVSSARDLTKLVVAAYQHPIIRYYSTNSNYAVEPGRHVLHYKNSNNLISNPAWEIGLQKTGYISEAGRCLVMQATIDGRQVVMVFLDSKGKYSRSADAARVRKWLEGSKPSALARPIVAQQG